MKRQDILNLRKKSVKELNLSLVDMQKTMAKDAMEAKVNPPKDTNALSKKKKMIAITNTIIFEKLHEQDSIQA